MQENVLVFDSINIKTPKEKIYARLGFCKGKTKLSDDKRYEIDQFIDDALLFISLKGAARKLAFRAVKGKVALISGEVFESNDLASFLTGSKELLAVAATCGNEIFEELVDDEDDNNSGGLTRKVVFDAVASEMVDAALTWITEYFSTQLRRENKVLTKTRFSCGYGDFKLSNQKIIYDMLELDRIGVGIADTFILLPEKSVTAIVGVANIT